MQKFDGFTQSWFAFVAMTACLLMAGASACRNSSNSESESEIDPPPPGLNNPNRPVVVFPAEFQQKDPAINQYIQDALQICAEGDYDKFRGLFGINFIQEAPGKTQFDRVWRGVKQVNIANVQPGKHDDYYVHVVIQLKQKNRKDEIQRQTVVWIHKEENAWCLGTAPKEITRRMLAPATRPADKQNAVTQPATQPG